MFRRELCSHCQTGKHSYELDSRSPECPYLLCHNGKKCGMYVPLKKESFFAKLLNSVQSRTK